jgi:hypothetical protein
VVDDALVALRAYGLRNLVRAGSVAMATNPRPASPRSINAPMGVTTP